MFNYTKRAFQHSADDDDLSDDGNFENDKGKGTSKKRKVDPKKGKNIKNTEVVIKKAVPSALDDEDNNSDDDVTILEKADAARNAMNLLLAKSNNDNKEELVHAAVVDDENLKKARELLIQINSAKRQLSVPAFKEDMRIIPAVASTLILPTVRIRPAAEKAAPVLKSAEEMAESLLVSLCAPSNPLKVATSSSSAAAFSAVDDGAPRIRLTTRLNGKHEWRVKFAVTDKFEKLRQALARMYDIPPAMIKMSFDGDSLSDNQRPSDVDMEDDNMIDLLIPKDKVDAAIAAASEKKTISDVALPDVAVPGVVGPVVATLRIRTRLNGKHEWRVKLPMTDKLEKVRLGLSNLYNLPTSAIKMSFDGMTLTDNQTPEDADMDDDILIDVTIPKEKYDAAAAAANEKKSSSEVAIPEAVIPDVVGPVVATIRIRTRLNGKHEWRVKLPMTDKFEKLRVGLSKMYNLPTSAIKMSFDGMTLTDNQTPEDADMDDDILIDVTIPKGKYDAAAAAANEKKTILEALLLPPVPASPIPVPYTPEFAPLTPPIPAHLGSDSIELPFVESPLVVLQSAPKPKTPEPSTITIHITVPQWFTTQGVSSLELEVTVFKGQTLQSMNDTLTKQSNLKLAGSSYVLSTVPAADLDPLMTFDELAIVTNSTLILRYKPVMVMFILDGFTYAKANTLIVEPVAMKVRLNTVLGKIFDSIGSHVGKPSNTLDFFLDSGNINVCRTLTLQQTGINDGSEIIVLSRK